jgi:hypothetical protein
MSQVVIERTRDYLVVKIPLKAVKERRAGISTKGQLIVDQAIADGLLDIEAGRTFGPFGTVREFKKALKRSPSLR